MTAMEKTIKDYTKHLWEEERSETTIKKYEHDIRRMLEFIKDEKLSKTVILKYKAYLEENYKPASVNSMIAAANSFLEFIGHSECKIKPLKIQRAMFIESEREINKNEYIKLLETAKQQKNTRLMLIIETLASTGIRISELKFITVEAVNTGKSEINCKGKHRTVLLTPKLCKVLKDYIKSQNIKSGSVFISKKGNPVDNSNIRKEMKKLAELANVEKEKVYPHNFRHFFARIFYSNEKDLVRLADVLGHSSINTTRIYTAESGAVHLQQLKKMNLVYTS